MSGDEVCGGNEPGGVGVERPAGQPGPGGPKVAPPATPEAAGQTGAKGSEATKQLQGDGLASGIAGRIAGLSALKGLVVYGATLTFAGFYAYFIERIVVAQAGQPPKLNTVMVSVAAALAGVLGSAFALVIGVPTTVTNRALAAELDKAKNQRKTGIWVWRVLSLEPGGGARASIPLTFGIWTYAIVAGAVAITYFINQGETPDTIKALATVFAGYVVALMTAAYGLATGGSRGGT